MSGFISSITVLCVSLFCAAIIKLIAPAGNTEKILKRVISLFIIICTALCIKSVLSFARSQNFSEISSIHSTKLIDSIDENVLSSTADYLADYIDKLLKSEGIETEYVEISLFVDDENVINISEVCIYVDKETNADKQYFAEIISNSFGISPEISIKEEK